MNNNKATSYFLLILSFVGFLIIIFEILFINKYNGSGIKLFQIDIEAVYLFLLALWLQVPSAIETVIKKNLSWYNILRSYIALCIITFLTVIIIAGTILRFMVLV